MVISLVCMHPFLAVERARETAMAELSVTIFVQLVMKLVVAQFCRAIINEGAECVQSENMMQFSHHHQLATSLLPCSQSLGRYIAGQ